jgi:hypothetical protein
VAAPAALRRTRPPFAGLLTDARAVGRTEFFRLGSWLCFAAAGLPRRTRLTCHRARSGQPRQRLPHERFEIVGELADQSLIRTERTLGKSIPGSAIDPAPDERRRLHYWGAAIRSALFASCSSRLVALARGFNRRTAKPDGGGGRHGGGGGATSGAARCPVAGQRGDGEWVGTAAAATRRSASSARCSCTWFRRATLTASPSTGQLQRRAADCDPETPIHSR